MTNSRNKTGLVVDDEPDVRRYLKTILEDAGFTVHTAADGEAALQMIRREPPDFISLDLVMPNKSGHKVLFELKRDPALSRIPVLIVTAHAQDDLGKGDLQDLLQQRVISGPGTYLEKPVSPQTYVRSIERALGLEESEQPGEQSGLQRELQAEMLNASPEALRQALAALKQREGSK